MTAASLPMPSPRAFWGLPALFVGMLVGRSAVAGDPPPENARGWESPPPTTGDEAALLVPRVVLFVPRLVLTAAFYPIEAGLRFLGRRTAGGSVRPGGDDPVRTIALLPHLSYLSGFGTTVGLSARYENIGGNDEEAALNVVAGGLYTAAAELSLRADRTVGSRLWLESRTRYEMRPQEVFAGIGDGEDARPTRETRFREKRMTVLERAGVTTGSRGHLVKVGATGMFVASTFGAKDTTTGEPSIADAYDVRALPGWVEGARTLEVQSNLVVDTRTEVAATSSGILAQAFAGGARAQGHDGFGHLGFDVTGYFDIYAKTRVLVLRAAFEGVIGRDRDIPFTRLATLGGPETLRGYRLDRYRDREAAVVSAEYRYPIHRLVAGALFIEAGHVGPDPEELVSVRRWRADGGIGLRIRSSDTTFASLDLAGGSEGAQLFFTVFPFDSRSQWNKP